MPNPAPLRKTPKVQAPPLTLLSAHLSGTESHPGVLCSINVVFLNSAGAGLPCLWRNPILEYKTYQSLITDSLEPNTVATRNSCSEILFQGWGDALAVRSTCCFSRVHSLVPNTPFSRLTTACNPSSKGSNAIFWPPWPPTYAWHTHRQMRKYRF